MTPAPPLRIETPRLVLSPPGPEDIDAVFAYASDPAVTRYLGWPRHVSRDDTQAFLSFVAMRWQAVGVGAYLIRLRDSGEVIGSTGLDLEQGSTAMTGYVLATRAWGRGYATEALTAMVDLARSLALVELVALCHVDHHASQRVLIKCGFERADRPLRAMMFPNLDASRPIPALEFSRRP